MMANILAVFQLSTDIAILLAIIYEIRLMRREYDAICRRNDPEEDL